MRKGEKKMKKNEMDICFDSRSENESFARMVVAGFITYLDPTLEEMGDIKTAVSEAVTNCVIHGYNNGPGKIHMKCRIEDKTLQIEISDEGVGIENIRQAMEPLYTTKPDLERSGMGFAFMEAFMDGLHVESVPGKGTKVVMEKLLGVCINEEAI